MWEDFSAAQCSSLTSGQKAWLGDSGSLTQRLKSHYPSGMDFRLLFEGKGDPHCEELKLLDLTGEHQQWIREIAWYFQQQCWIVARVVVPLQQGFEDVIAMGSRSIGNLLFRNNFIAEPIQVQQIPTTHPYHAFASGTVNLVSDSKLWARRRTFLRDNKRLLVSEIFLPDFFRAIHE